MYKDLHLSSALSSVDWLVFGLVLLLTLAAVLWGHWRRRHHVHGEAGMLDLLLMGRRLTLPLFTATLVATWYGGILPVTEYAFDNGLYSWVTQGFFWYSAYLVFAFLLVGRVRSTEARTMPEMLEGLFGPFAGRVGAWFNLLNVLPVVYVLSLGIFLQRLFGGGVFAWMAAGTALVVLYSTLGGLRSVVYSDLVQFVVMCASVAMIVAFSMARFGGIGWLRASPHIPDGHWNPMGEGIPLGGTLVWGLVAFGTLVDPNFYQRCLAARDAATARRGILLATVVWIGFDFCTTFGAFYALAAIPGAEKSTAYLVYGVQLLPPGLRGFFLAGVLATILSTLDSYLFLCGTLVSVDLAPRRWRNQVRLHHLGTVAMAAVAVLATQLFANLALVEIWKFFGGMNAACLLAPLMIGMAFPGRVRDRCFALSTLGGALAMIVFLLARAQGGEQWNDFWKGMEPFYFGLAASLPGPLADAFRRPGSSG